MRPYVEHRPGGRSVRIARLLAVSVLTLEAVGCGAEGEIPDASPPPPAAEAYACSGNAVRATVELTAAGPMLLGAALVDVEVEPSTGAIEVLDGAGQVLAMAALPELAPRSIIAPEGEVDGDAVPTDSAIVSVLAPWPAGATSVRLGALEIDSPVCADWLGKADGTRVEPELVRGGIVGLGLGRFDLVVLGDGYRANQLATFRTDATRLADALLGQEPFKSYRNLINVWRLPVASPEAGAGTGSAKDTAFGCYYGCSGLARLVCCDSTRVLGVAQGSVPSFDGIVMLVNDPRYGGAGDPSYASAYNGTQMTQVLAHEFAHQLQLLDEYTYSGFSAHYPATINCAEGATSTPWEPWRGVSGVGAFAGCGAADHYRPTDDGCLMKSIGKPFCPVCAEHLVKQIVAKAGNLALEAWPPPGTTVTIGSSAQTFRLTPALSTTTVEWRLDGAPLTATGNQLTLSSCEGTELEARLTHSTPFVRNDPSHLLTRSLRWTIACE